MWRRVEQLADGVTLYLADCRDVLAELAEVDVIITDPPYGPQTHAGARSTQAPDRPLIDFAPLEGDALVGFCRRFVAVANRWVVLTCEWQQAVCLERAGAPLVRVGVWVKLDSAPQFSGDRPAMGWEAVALLHREGRKRWNGGGARAVWTHPIVRGVHPTQKPEGLLTEWVRSFSEPNETILDPFMGSGTTGVAAVKLGRRFIGVEVDEVYFDMALRRVSDALRQPRLFVPQRGLRRQEEFEL